MKNSKCKKGKVIYNEFHIDFNKSFDEQVDCLNEDLLQIQYGTDYLLDIGWYPEFETNGKFVVQLIKSYNWDNPLFYKKCVELNSLKRNVQEVMDLVNNLL